MSAERAIYEILSTDGGVSQLVGDRIHPIIIDQGVAYPAIAYQQISGPREHNVSGAIGWVMSRYQITCWARGDNSAYLQAVDLATAVRIAVDGYSGTAASLVIDHIFVVDEGDVSDLFAENTELNIYGKRIDAQIVFKE